MNKLKVHNKIIIWFNNSMRYLPKSKFSIKQLIFSLEINFTMKIYWHLLKIIVFFQNSKNKRKFKLKTKAAIKNQKVQRIKISKLIVKKLSSVSKNKNQKLNKKYSIWNKSQNRKMKMNKLKNLHFKIKIWLQ